MSLPLARKASLVTLPTEVLQSILDELRLCYWDRAALRITNKRFYNLILAPTFDEIFIMERRGSVYHHSRFLGPTGPFLACGYCLRLRPREKFAAGMIEYHEGKRFPGNAYDWQWGTLTMRKWELMGSGTGTKARCRFCIECGPRPMDAVDDGTHRYRGDTWEEDGVPFTRCLRCGRCARAWKKNRSMCAECHTQLDAQFPRLGPSSKA